jgi:hypothetical protein
MLASKRRGNKLKNSNLLNINAIIVTIIKCYIYVTASVAVVVAVAVVVVVKQLK